MKTEDKIKELEQNLNELEFYIKDLWRSYPIPLIYVNPIGIIMSAGQAIEKLYGQPAEEMIGKSLPDLFPHKEKIREIEAETREKGSSNNREVNIADVNGNIVPVSISTQTRLDHEGNVIGYFVSLTNLTERKRLEEQYQTIIRTSIDGFWITDMQGHFQEVNDSYCRMIGYSRDELSKMAIMDIEAVEKPEETAARIKKIIATGGDRFESKHRHKDGRIIDIEVSVNYLKAGEGRLAVFLHDITKRKRTEEELKIHTEELEKMNRFMTGRELDMIEIKKEVNLLLKELGRPEKYKV